MKKNLITTAIVLALPNLAWAQNEQSDNALQAIHVYSAYATPVNQDKPLHRLLF